MATVALVALAFEDPSLVVTFTGQLGEPNGAAHKPMYKKAADGKYWLATAGGTAEQAGESGIAISLQEGQVDEYVSFIAAGKAIVEGTLTEGETYVLGGAAAGDINPDVDATGQTPDWYKTWLFIAGGPSGSSNTEILIAPLASGYQRA